MQKGFKAVLQVKIGHALCPKKIVGENLKEVLESILEANPLTAIGYRYSI